MVTIMQSSDEPIPTLAKILKRKIHALNIK